jgi:ketosteroid isomerase-like protein
LSRANVEIVLDQFGATNDRDFERAMTYYAEDVQLVVDTDAFLQGGTFRGREAVGRWFGDWFATFESDYSFEIEEARDLGAVVFLDASHRGRGRSSGVEVHGRTGYLYTVREGKIVRVELFSTPAVALAAHAAGSRVPADDRSPQQPPPRDAL